MATINDDDKVIEMQIRLKSYAKEIQQIIADYRGEIEERYESLIQSMHRTNAESLDTLDARIRAEARAEALKEAADDYAHGSWGNYVAIHFLEWLAGRRHITKPEDINIPAQEVPRLLEQAERYEKELAGKHAAILADEPKEERGAEEPSTIEWSPFETFWERAEAAGIIKPSADVEPRIEEKK